MRKMIKPLVATSAIALLLVGCSNDKEVAPGAEEKANDVAQVTSKSLANSLYEMKDSEILVELNGEKLTLGEVKQKAFENTLLSEINQFTERVLLIEKYGPTDEELDKEFDRMTEAQKSAVVEGEDQPAKPYNTIEKETLRYNLAYEKAVNDGIEVTKEDLLKIKKEFFPNEERTYAEMEEELKRIAPYYIGNNVYEITSKLKKEAKLKFVSEDLKKHYETTFSTPAVDTVKEKETPKVKNEEKTEKE